MNRWTGFTGRAALFLSAPALAFSLLVLWTGAAFTAPESDRTISSPNDGGSSRVAPTLATEPVVGRGYVDGGSLQVACPDPAALTEDLGPTAADIFYLSHDELRGREVATEGERCAGDYLAERFRELGLQAPGPDGSYFHSFRIRTGAVAGENNRLALARDGSRDAPRETPREDWTPYGFSASAETSAPLVYGGYGISTPESPAGSYATLDLEGRIVVLEDGDPSGDRSTVYSDPHFKATVAAGRGAAGVIVLLPEGAALPDLADEVRAPLQIAAAAARGAAASALRSAAREGGSVTLSTDVSPRTAVARNVVALLPGSDPELSDEWVVVGAHYDHLGLGGEGSLAPDEYGSIHNGADDNASGTAAIVEAARILSEGQPPQRSVLFIGFTGEEKGLWGSSYYVSNPLHPIERTVAMLNLDMVGRLEEGPLTVFGVGTAEEWTEVVDEANGRLRSPLELSYVPDGYGASDHTSFYSQGIPVLHFFTNTHEDYHRPSDDFGQVDVPGVERVAELVAGVTRSLSGGPERQTATLTLVQDENPHAAAGAQPGDSGDPGSSTSGYGPYLGTVPDMTPSENGVRLTGVRDGSPAEAAGIQPGDTVVEFAGREITDIYSYTYALQDQQPGDTVRIVVEREDGERVPVTAILERR